jgi:hypothetical protein
MTLDHEQHDDFHESFFTSKTFGWIIGIFMLLLKASAPVALAPIQSRCAAEMSNPTLHPLFQKLVKPITDQMDADCSRCDLMREDASLPYSNRRRERYCADGHHPSECGGPYGEGEDV